MKTSRVTNALIIFLMFQSLIFFQGCKDEDSGSVVTEEALLIWGGDYAADGCGYTLEMNDKIYKPENEDFISDEYKIHPPTSVVRAFEYLNRDIEYFCGMRPTKNEGIKIISIKKL